MNPMFEEAYRQAKGGMSRTGNIIVYGGRFSMRGEEAELLTRGVLENGEVRAYAVVGTRFGNRGMKGLAATLRYKEWKGVYPNEKGLYVLSLSDNFFDGQ